MQVRERLIRLIQSSQQPILRRKLVSTFDVSRRKEAEQELSLLVSEGYVNPLGTGRRGMPFRVVTSETWPFNKCPFCHQEMVLRDTPNP